jgi:uncharacterized protein YecA (UPF0149 family)
MLLGLEQESSVIETGGVVRTQRGAATTRRMFLTAAQLGITLALGTFSLAANPATVIGDSPELSLPPCYSLMTDNECHVYRVTLASATTPAARDAIKARFDRMQHEREETCPCSENHEWILIKQSPSKVTGYSSRYRG